MQHARHRHELNATVASRLSVAQVQATPFAHNTEPNTTTHTMHYAQVIFTIVRCLHCDVSNRAGFIEKKDWEMPLYAFQIEWLEAVKLRCSHKSVEKTVRIILNYYRNFALKDVAFEEALFRKNRKSL